MCFFFEYRSLSIADLVQQMFFPSNIHCSIDTKKGLYMAAMCIFRGEDLSTKLINEELTAIQEKNSTVTIFLLIQKYSCHFWGFYLYFNVVILPYCLKLFYFGSSCF